MWSLVSCALIVVRHYLLILPVVIRAERIAAGDHVGWNDLMYAAAPDTCGHDIDVPDMILNSNVLLSLEISEIGAIGDQLAIMSTPGATKSGYNIKQTKKLTTNIVKMVEKYLSF